MHIDCTICNDRITNPENISVARCGHIFHFMCLTTFVKRKMMECPVCCKMISPATIKQILPTKVDRQEDHQCNQDPSQSMSNDEQKRLQLGKQNQNPKLNDKHEVNECLETAKNKSPTSVDRPSVLQSPLNDNLPLLQHPTDYQKRITDLHNKLMKKKLKMKKLKDQKERYYKNIQDLKKGKQTVLDESKLQEENKHNIADIKKLKESNETLQKELQILKTKLDTTKKDLETASSRVGTLPDNDTEATRHLIKENDDMKKDLKTLKEVLAGYDSAVTSLMLTKLNRNVLHENSKLCKSITTLQKENNKLKKKVDILHKRSHMMSESKAQINNAATERDYIE